MAGLTKGRGRKSVKKSVAKSVVEKAYPIPFSAVQYLACSGGLAANEETCFPHMNIMPKKKLRVQRASSVTQINEMIRKPLETLKILW